MKNKLSLFAVPYVVWMALFVVAPIIMVVIYAFSTSVGGFTLGNFAKMGTYTVAENCREKAPRSFSEGK